MAAVIQLEVRVDDQGVVQGVNRVVDSLNKVPGAGQRAFQTLSSEQKKAREAAQLLSQTLGVQVPQALEKIIAKAPGVSTALSAAFKVSAVAAFVVAIGEGLRNIDSIKGKLVNLAYDVGAGFEGALQKVAGWFDVKLPKSMTALADRMKRLDNEKTLEPVIDRLNALNAAAQLAGTEGIGQIRAQLAATNKELDVFAQRFNRQIEEQFGVGTARTAQLQGQASAMVSQMRSAAGTAATKQIGKATEDSLFSAHQTLLAAEAAATHGLEQIELEHKAKLEQIRQQETKTGVYLLDEYVAANKDRDTKIAELHRAAADQIFDADQKAALAGVSEWEKTNASIVADFEAREREIRKNLKDTVIDEQEANRLREANWKETNARMAQDYASQFESLYNDITNGGIGQRIKAQMRKFFFELAGQWAANLQGQRQGSNGNGILGLLGSILGIGGLGSGVPLYGSSTVTYPGTPPFISNFADVGFGGTAGVGTVLVEGKGGSDVAPIPGGSPVGGASGGVTPRQAGVFSGLGAFLSNPGKLGPLATLVGLNAALTSPNGATAAGVGIGGLLAALSFKNPALAGSLAFLSPVAGGLVGYGVGSQHGPIAGGLSGGATGALTGLLVAGPIGAAIGGIVGGLVGLFSGIFGGKPSKHSQADKWLQSNVLPLISQELAAYEGFGLDYTTAINDLDRLKSTSYDQMRQQFGKDATNDEWGKFIVPAIKQAEDRINSDQAERNRRSSLMFSPPQFASGGVFSARVAGGAGVAILHDQERVMTARASRRFGSALEAMERSASSGVPMSGGDHVTIYAVDAQSFEGMMKRHGWQTLKNMARVDRLEGRA